MPGNIAPSSGNLIRADNSYRGVSKRWYSDGSIDGTYFGPSQHTYGENFSHGHPRDQRGNYKGSSDWLMYKFEARWFSEHVKMYRQNYSIPAYVGLQNTNGLFPWGFPPITIEQIHLENFNRGAEAFAAIRPATPDFSALSNLFELKDLFSDLKRRVYDDYLKVDKSIRRHGRRAVGNEQAEWQLALHFGWGPLFNDVKNFVNAFHNRKKRFDQLLRDEGKSVRRSRNLTGSFNKGKFDSINDTTWHGAPYNLNIGPTMETQCYAPVGTAHTVRTAGNSTRVWCVGRSRYLLPDGPRDEPWKRNIMKRIMGGNLTPRQVWQVIPWSWFADYFSGLGHFLDAVSPGVEDQIVIDGGWVMTSTEYWDKRQYVYYYYSSPTGGSEGSSFAEVRRFTKARSNASPFGFGLESPTDKQIQILGILGFSKLNR